MRTTARRDEPWRRQAARGVGMVLVLCLGVFAAGLALSAAFVWAMG